MRHVLTSAAEFKSITIAIGPITMIGSCAFGNGNRRRLSVQVPAVIGIVVGSAAFEFIAAAAR